MRNGATGVLIAFAVGGLGLWPVPAARPDAPVSKKPISAARLANADEMRRQLGLLPEYADTSRIDSIKIAVLDYGFDGIDGIKPYLPQSAVIVEHYDPDLIRRFHLGDPGYRKSFAPGNRHGRTMAQIVWAMTGMRPGGPKFYLLNANGPTMLRRAVRYAIEAKVDIILFSGTFEGGGNGDGRGPINRIVADALAADILWINAAGNFGQRVYSGPVRLETDGYLRFREGADGTALRFRNRLEENPLTVTLTWNDYRDQEDAGTTKDLDLYVEDWQGQRVAAGEMKQIAGNGPTGPGESRNPRERIELPGLPASADFNYRIRVRARSGTFTPEDRIRVLITAGRDTYLDPANGQPTEAVKFFDASGRDELFPPADNPLVLTVGEAGETSSVGPTADHRVKPDVILADSHAAFTDGEMTGGASNAAAYFAGIVALLKAEQPGLKTRHLLRLTHPDSAKRVARYGNSLEPPPPPRPRDTRTPPPSPSPRQGRALMVDPARGQVTLLGRRFAVTGDLPGRSFSVERLATPPRETAEVFAGTREADLVKPLLGSRRLWQTPTRQQLDDLIRTDP